MPTPSYDESLLPVSNETALAHQSTFKRIARSGAWWPAHNRLAIVEEARLAVQCKLCAEKVKALSANTVKGEHDNSGKLPAAAVEVIHAVRNDPGRLTRNWFDGIMRTGLDREAYVELVSVLASSVVIDTFSQAVGSGLQDLPEAKEGELTYESSDAVEEAGAWLPIAAVPANEHSANILRSMGLVPSAVELFFGSFRSSYYMGGKFELGRRQVELIASRVSSVNQCFY